MIYYFLYGLSFFGLGLAAYLQLRRGGDFPLRKLLPWLAAFGFTAGAAGCVDMFLVNETNAEIVHVLEIVRIALQSLSGLILFIFGWGIFARLQPLPSWTIFVPGVLIVPLAYALTYALSTFVTSSPLEIPIDIWSRYLLYLPGSIMAGVGFLRQWNIQRKLGYTDVAKLMLGAGVAFLFEAFVMGMVVPAAPYGPASYYNYDRVLANALSGEITQNTSISYGLTAWLDYQRILEVTGLPIEFWRMLSSLAVTGFVMRGLDVFEAVQRRQLQMLQMERDRAQQAAFNAQITARHTAENWSDALVRISSRIAELEDVDSILVYIVTSARQLLNADFIGLALADQDATHLHVKYYASADQAESVHNEVPVENPLITDVMIGQFSYRSKENEPRERLEDICFFGPQDAGSVAAVPLNLDTQTIGVLWAARFEPHVFSEMDLIWLECLADQVMIAVKHGVMTSQLQTLAITEERGRIAREMHDGLAQVLGYLNLQVQTVESFLQQGKLDKAQIKLDQMHDAVQAANADVRENILSLRTTLSSDKGVVPSIQEYLEEFGLQTNIKTHFANEAGEELDLASLAEVQLVCILQEALANVRKHAHAENISVNLQRLGAGEDQSILMEIVDDGVGFEAAAQKRSFGLQTMHERAESVYGSLHVWSTREHGTRVECRMPCVSHEQFHRPDYIYQDE